MMRHALKWLLLPMIGGMATLATLLVPTEVPTRQAMADVSFGLPFRFARQDQSFLDPPSFPRTVALASVHESPPIIRLDLLVASWLFFVAVVWLIWGAIARVGAMSAVRRCELPAGALLNRYSGSGAFADCYVTELANTVSHAEFVEAFYTTSVFKLERWILRLLVSRASTDDQASQLARGTLDSFAAWSVEGRAPDQLLLSDFTGRTKSWLMVTADADNELQGTRLFFGSAVAPVRNPNTGRAGLGFVFNALLGFHKLYSQVLLSAARSRLSR